MNNIWKLAVFIAVELVLTQMISLIFRLISRRNKGVHLRYAKSAINVTIIVVGVYSLAQQFDFTKDISKVLLQSGSLIVAIATFAAQQALGNIISGFSLSMSKPYEVEDKIKVVQGGGIIAEGIVQDITIRHTIIRQFNGESCIVPNSVMDASVITNTNYTENIGNFMEIEIGYSADIDKAMDIMQKICINHELTLNTESNKVFIKGYTQNGMILKTTVWTKNLDDSFRACSDIRAVLVKEFQKNNIEIPYHTVTMCNGQETDL